MLARCGGLPRNTRSRWGETHAQYRNSQFSKLVDNMPMPVNPLEAVVTEAINDYNERRRHNSTVENCQHAILLQLFMRKLKAVGYKLLHKPGSRHCHLAIGRSTIRQRVFDCKYLSWKICFNILNYVFILFSFNLYCLANIQQHCHNCSHCDWRHHI